MKKLWIKGILLMALGCLLPGGAMAAGPVSPAEDGSADLVRAQAFVAEWLDSWNRHDLEGTVAYFSDDYEVASPLIRRLMGVESGTLKGRAAAKEYNRIVLERYPDIKMSVINYAVGINSAVVHWQAETGGVTRQGIDTFFFRAGGQLYKVNTCYLISP